MVRGSDWGGSRLGTAQTCKAKYNYRYNTPHPDGHGPGIIQIDDKEAPSKGTLLHTCLQTYYNLLIKDANGDKTDYAVKAIMAMLDEMPQFKFSPEKMPLIRDELIAAADQYFQHYLTDDIIPIATEVAVEVEIQLPDGTWHKHTGIVDLLARWHSGALFVVDHKTTSMSFASLFGKYTFSLSFKGYCKAVALKHGEVTGVLINAIRFKKNKALEVELQREHIIYEEKDLAEFEPTVRSILREIQMCEQDGFWPKASDQCVQVWGECEYMPLCKFPEAAMIAGKYRGANYDRKAVGGGTTS